jgi:FMN phosphatase YigB (HAD superfamily)
LPTHPPVISIDFDGTLIRNPYWSLHLKPWLLSQSPGENKSWQDLWELMAQESDWRRLHGDHTGAYDWKNIAGEILHASLPDPDPPSRKDVLALVYPDVWDFLTWSFRHRVSLHVVTNGLIRNQWPYLQALGWDKILTSWIGADSGFAKPDPRIFQRISGLAVHVGDRLAHDVLGAKRASVLAVHLQRPWQKEDNRGWDPLSPAGCHADLTITTLRQLPELLTQRICTTRHGKAGWV